MIVATDFVSILYMITYVNNPRLLKDDAFRQLGHIQIEILAVC
jgi:hypothetical protein